MKKVCREGYRGRGGRGWYEKVLCQWAGGIGVV